MLRPSRPMIRPFISSLGRCRTVTVCSAVWSAADEMFYCAARDLTERIRLEVQLGRAQRLEAVGKLTGGVKKRRLREARFAVPLHGAARKTAHVRILAPGGFPVQLRIDGRKLAPHALGRIVVTAIDPWGRRATFVLGFRAP